MKQINNNLSTPEIELLDINSPLKEYPRPQFKRESYLSLNGQWDYKLTYDYNDIFSPYEGKILVPYCLESKNSQVNKALNKGQYIIYHRHLTLTKDFLKKNTLINFLGVDQEFTLIINNCSYGPFKTYMCAKTIDISTSIKVENEIFVIVKDDLNQSLPHGKQVNKAKGMFYTSCSGIYFPVLIESMEDNYIENIFITPTLEGINLKIKSSSSNFKIKIYVQDTLIKKINTDKKDLYISIDNPHLWDIEDPFLYNLIVETENDKIQSYFGLRTIKAIDNQIYLNNKKIFLNGLLDQGYYPEGIYTVSDYKSYEKDILTMKELGFNLLRKHMKVECDYFYYLCDKYGMLIMQDFIFTGKYNFMIDTAFPTIGLKSIKKINKKKNIGEKINFYRHGSKIINDLYNHPCIIAYTIFNEGWGQFMSDRVFTYFKNKDLSRLFDATSGWFKNNNSDFESQHIYFKKIKITYSHKKPLLISEFGGFVFKINDHSYNLNQTFGYKFFKNRQDYQNGFILLYKEQILPYKEQLCGVIYTQLSDVEDETNGLFTYDRKILKVNKNVLKEISEDIK